VNKQITILCLIISLTSFFAALLIKSNYIIGGRNSPLMGVVIIIALLAFAAASANIGARKINQQIGLLQNRASLLSNRITANISHDFKTPLTAIIGYTQCMLDGYDGEINPEQEIDLERVIKNATNLSLLIDDMVDLAKVETGRIELSPSVFLLSECVTGVIASLQSITEGNASQLNVDIPGDLPPILADFTKVRRVLLNLIQNALETSREGMMTISARAFDQYYAEVSISSTKGNRNAEAKRAPFAFSSHEWAPAQFERLETILDCNQKFDAVSQPEFKIEYKRADWGLILAQKLVTLHTGSLYVERDAGNGTVAILFTLPLATPKLRKYIWKDLNEELDDKQREIASKIYKWLA